MFANSRLTGGTGSNGPDRRRYPRFELALPGRYMLENRQEFSCRTREVSAAGIVLSGPRPSWTGGPIVAYLDRLGRVEGVVSRLLDMGFVIDIDAPDRKRERLAMLIRQMADRPDLAAPRAP